MIKMIVEESNQELRDDRALDYFQSIVEVEREPLVILDFEQTGGRVDSQVVKPMDFEGFSASVAELGHYWVLVNQEPK